MDLLRRHLTYANVAATLALFLALGGAAYAATQLPKNSVGTKQLKKGAVTAAKINKKTRNALRGPQGPAGPQGKTGKTGAKGATGAQGKTGVAGADGTGPAFEVFASTPKAIGTTSGAILAQNLTAGAYVISANVSLAEGTAASIVTCTLSGGGEAVGLVEAGVPTTLSLSVLRTISGTGTVTLNCSATAGATAKYANLVATQVKSIARAPG